MKLDKQADIVIADHALANSPAGSISWKYIQDSVNDGVLKDPEEYPARPHAQAPQLIGSGQPPKKTRRAFTAEDDLVLARWVAEAERDGRPTSGNALYQELEAKVWIVYLGWVYIELTECCRMTGIPPSHGATVMLRIGIAFRIFN